MTGDVTSRCEGAVWCTNQWWWWYLQCRTLQQPGKQEMTPVVVAPPCTKYLCLYVIEHLVQQWEGVQMWVRAERVGSGEWREEWAERGRSGREGGSDLVVTSPLFYGPDYVSTTPKSRGFECSSCALLSLHIMVKLFPHLDERLPHNTTSMGIRTALGT